MRSGYPATKASKYASSVLDIARLELALRPSQATRVIFVFVCFGSSPLVASREPSRVV